MSVVVITHNRRDELDRTLHRLSDLPEQPRVIVVDNASTDGTADMVRAGHPEVTLLTPGKNLGAVGRNLGVDVADTPYVAFCDDDTWYEPGALRLAADLLDAHPTLGVVTASITVEPDGRLDDICTEMADSPLDRPPGIPGYPLLSFLAGVSIVRREAFLAAGGFSKRLWLGGEEELLASDLARAGWHMSYVPDVVAHHYASRLRDAHLRRRHGIRNTLWFTWLRRPLPSAALRTMRLLRRLPRDRISAQGVSDAVRGLPWVLRERKPVPADLERGYQQLEDKQLNGGARKYVS
ncbi:glycosyltransferase family 2 protein [Mycobacterium kubicae]|uniref:Glycosyltransferase n=1 Tax=Mycobacterium kubicae TaxID=120959 RepID=A0AAX1JAP9_9MYCO|nr:glycosyltransferase [Mycobacterium kubicae]MCV7093675.1 glycosyltransferase [Mycobacterium kubicae]QNI10164.1 glycosyltransferase [Mycobacterium kubicae]QPI38368.1 glycosyltransferase [Mycobacterium kubicae]